MTSSSSAFEMGNSRGVDSRELENSGVKVTPGFIEHNNQLHLKELAQENPELARVAERWLEV